MFSALASRDFRLLWLGQTVSMLGDGLVLVAVGLYVTRLTGDPADVGWVLGAYAAPMVLFIVLGGVVADRFRRQTVMIASDLVRMVLHGTLAALILTGTVQVWHMVVIGVLFGTAESFFRPAYTGLVPQTVPEERIQSAQALGGFSGEVATFVSPALATLLVLTVGGGWAFALDAATFGISALMLARVQGRERGEAVERTSMLRELREGWQAVRERAWVWATILAFSVSLLVALAPFFVLGPSVAETVYGTSAVFGLANAAWGLGTAIGILAGARWRPLRPMRAALLAASPWPFAITVYGAGPPVGVTYACLTLSGIGVGLFIVWWDTALAQRIPPHLLSRVSAWDWMGSLALLPVGYLLAGPLGEALGAQEVLAGGAVLGTLLLALGLLPSDTRRLPRTPLPGG